MCKLRVHVSNPVFACEFQNKKEKNILHLNLDMLSTCMLAGTERTDENSMKEIL
jgi:hypothetical protein